MNVEDCVKWISANALPGRSVRIVDVQGGRQAIALVVTKDHELWEGEGDTEKIIAYIDPMEQDQLLIAAKWAKGKIEVKDD